VSLARTRVEFLRNSMTSSLVQIFHAGPFGDVLSNQVAGIFNRTPLPGVIWIREVTAGVGRCFDIRPFAATVAFYSARSHERLRNYAKIADGLAIDD
jgi:hypothetical protein